MSFKKKVVTSALILALSVPLMLTPVSAYAENSSDENTIAEQAATVVSWIVIAAAGIWALSNGSDGGYGNEGQCNGVKSSDRNSPCYSADQEAYEAKLAREGYY